MADRVTNSGYRVVVATSNVLYFGASDGVSETFVTSGATSLTVGGIYLVTAWDDGTNLNVQVNNGAIASVARPMVAASGATFTEGKDHGSATAYFPGRIGTRVYTKDYCPSAAVREQIKRYVAASAGLSL